MKISKTAAAVACGVALVGAGLISSPASAEPSGTPTYRALAGVGSDTTENVMNGLANVITVGGTKVIASYNANGGGNIVTKDPAVNPSCTIARPNGSGAGRTAFLNSLNANAGAGNGCVDFSRSSSAKGTVSTTPDLTWIPFATDAVTFAVRSDGDILRSLTEAEVINYFKCGDPTVFPVLPQTGSGTRSFWIGKMGISETDITNGVYPCLTGAGTATSRAYQQENLATALKKDEITPFSIAQYQSQATGVVTDVRGKSVLGVVDGKVPTVTNNLVPYTRDVYNLIPTAKVATSPWSDVFVGGTSLICQNTDVIKSYGFLTTASCGDTSTIS